ncbi:MAG: hypothetical protein K2K98_01615 [Muribaculaceae bacterium]|nr:hypothetical protein [Muribaculaceae bacterium]
MEKSTLIIICIIGFLIGFIAYWFLLCKDNYNEFFARKDELEDPKTHFIIETLREKTFRNKVRAILYVIRNSILLGIVGSVFLGGGASMLVSQCSSDHSSPKYEYDDYEYFDDAHRPDRF